MKKIVRLKKTQMGQFLLLLSFSFAVAGWSQNTVSDWQNEHPDILLMKQSTFNTLSPSIRTQLEGHVLVYKDIPAIEDLEAFSGEEKKAPDHTTPTDGDAQYIKNWLGMHQEVRIVPRSVYDSASPETLQAYETVHALILAGEKITIADIQNYHP